MWNQGEIMPSMHPACVCVGAKKSKQVFVSQSRFLIPGAPTKSAEAVLWSERWSVTGRQMGVLLIDLHARLAASCSRINTFAALELKGTGRT